MKKETREQLEIFHRQREEAEKKALLEGENTDNPGGGSPTEEEQWTISGRKRRRAKESDVLPGVKLRKSSSSTSHPAASEKLRGASTAVVGKPEKKSTEDLQSLEATSPRVGVPVEKSPQPAHTEKAEQPSTTIKTLAPATTSALGLSVYSSDED